MSRGSENLNIPSHKSSKSGSTITRLTTSTDIESLRTIDKVPSAKPAVSNADRLWTQIDVLDDVKNMSQDIKLHGSFYNQQFSQQLSHLKASQFKLFETMYKQHHTNMKIDEQHNNLYLPNTSKIPDSASTANTTANTKINTTTTSANINPNPATSPPPSNTHFEEKQQIVNDFFNEKPNREAIYKIHNFNEMHEYIQEIKADLNQVGESMKKFDTVINKSW